MVRNPLVSVIIASYNRANYLPAAVSSVVNQTYPNFELLVIDDGSTDNTSDAIAPYQSDPRVTYHRQANSGQGSATNYGISQARGEYISFLDADDMWLPEKLALQIKAFEQHPDVSIFYSAYHCVDGEGNIIATPSCPGHAGCITSQLFIENFIGYGTTIVKKECFQSLGAFDTTFVTGLDYDLWLRLSTRYRFGYLPIPTLLYRLWPGQVTASRKPRVYENGILIMSRFLKDFPSLVDKGVRDEAWAHTYVGLGECHRETRDATGKALMSYWQAIRHKPTYTPAWKGIAKTILRY